MPLQNLNIQPLKQRSPALESQSLKRFCMVIVSEYHNSMWMMYFLIKRRMWQIGLKYIIQKLFGGSAELLLARLVKDRGIDLDNVIRLRKKLK